MDGGAVGFPAGRGDSRAGINQQEAEDTGVARRPVLDLIVEIKEKKLFLKGRSAHVELAVSVRRYSPTPKRLFTWYFTAWHLLMTQLPIHKGLSPIIKGFMRKFKTSICKSRALVSLLDVSLDSPLAI